MQVIKSFGHLFGGTLLVTGTSLGVGMLALPVATAAGGFLPSLFIYLICWLFMLGTGLLILEACIWMPKDANLITLSHHLLGRGGKVACWILYLFLFFCLMVAHLAGGGSVLTQLSANSITSWKSIILYLILFSPVVYLGTRWVDRLNLLLMAGAILTFLIFVGTSLSHVEMEKLMPMNWGKAWGALPIVFTAFGYQSLIPTLVTYMDRDIKKVRWAIIVGSSLPFLIYVIWEMLILGIIPLEGPGGLKEALALGQNAVHPLGAFVKNPTLITIGQAFAFFVLTTSYMGIAIAFVDFLADGLKVPNKGWNKVGICAIIFILPTLIALVDPSIFLQALNYAGGIGVALLLGALPIMMVWNGRYKQKLSLKQQQLPGGKALLCFMMLFIAIELVITLQGI
ncbi:MAG: tyrosine transporter [Chlamydiales bacterium]|nr:tyrosine transporter [Chlamydiales bacterium]